MATNLDIDQEKLEKARALYGFKTKKETVNAALDELIRRREQSDILALQGSIDYHPDYDYKAQRLKR